MFFKGDKIEIRNFGEKEFFTVKKMYVDGRVVLIRDKTGEEFTNYCKELENKCIRIHYVKKTEAEVESYARECKKILENTFKVSKATLKDLKVVVKAKYNRDFAPAFKTKLYNEQSVEYCRSLEILNRILK